MKEAAAAYSSSHTSISAARAQTPRTSFASWPKPAGKKEAISGSMSYSTRCVRIISRLSKNGRPRKQSRLMRLQLTRRNTGTALGRSPAALWTNVFIKSWSKTHVVRWERAEGERRWSYAASSMILLGSVRHRRRARPIGPCANRDHLNSHPFFRIICRQNRRARQVGSPAFRRVARNEKHQMWMPVRALIAQILVLRHHVAHRTRLQRGQFLLIQCQCGRLDDRGLRLSRQHKFGLHQVDWHKGSCGRRIKTNGTANFGIPEFRMIRGP